MKVIFPDEVQELQFDAETGEPMDAEGQDDFGTTGAVGVENDGASSVDDSADDDFPIEMKQ